MLRSLACFTALLGFLGVVACSGTEPPGSSGTGTGCAAGQRFFNGQCLTECKTNAQCAAGRVCVALDATGGVCVAGQEGKCAYLGSDTKCVGIDSYYYHGFRGSAEYVPFPSDPPNATKDGLTPYTDYGFYSNYGNYSGTQGCQGNAAYVTVVATTDPACAERHAVVRCRRVGNACSLVAGTTPERFAP